MINRKGSSGYTNPPIQPKKMWEVQSVPKGTQFASLAFQWLL